MNLLDLQGWVKPTEKQVSTALKSLPMPFFSDISQVIYGSGRGKTVLSYLAVKKLLGKYIEQVQTIGDCTALASGHVADYLDISEIIEKKELEEWLAPVATEPFYWAMRVNIGKGQLGSSDGGIGAWCAQAATQIGFLIRKKYDNEDFTVYSGAKARAGGMPGKGLTGKLLEEAKKYPIKTTSLIKTYEEARDALANYYPINVCSNRGFNNVRDKDGFLRPSGTWAHSMAVIGVDDNPNRPGVCILNSWPKGWVTGPKRLDQPDGSFWVDADVFESMLKQGDSYAYSGRVGFPKRKLNLRIV